MLALRVALPVWLVTLPMLPVALLIQLVAVPEGQLGAFTTSVVAR